MSRKEIATFSLGCFWGPEDYFSRLGGVISTRVGYTGGSTPHPSYTLLGDHSEALRIVFDPDEISYLDLLDHFWKKHNPTIFEKRQYRSAIYYHDEKQREDANFSKKRMEMMYEDEILTSIEPVGEFYEAEEYHQKYFAKKKGEA